MKKTIKQTSALLLAVIILVFASACGDMTDPTGLWENATYLSDTTVGDGANTVKVEIVAGENSVTLTVKTHKATLGEALFEHGIINDVSFFDTCNGIKADWNSDQAYWAFYVDGELASHGVNDEKAVVSEDADYKLVYSK